MINAQSIRLNSLGDGFSCLGYIVFSGVRRLNGVQGLRVIVQSDRTPAYVEGRIEAFLQRMDVSLSFFSFELGDAIIQDCRLCLRMCARHFLFVLQAHICDMPQEVFEKHVKALAIKRLEKPKKLSTQHSKYWGEISSQQYNFDRGMVLIFTPDLSNSLLF